MKITVFPLSIVFLSISFPFYKRKNEAQRNKEWKQWEEDEKWLKLGKKEWKQWENDEKPRKHIKSMMKPCFEILLKIRDSKTGLDSDNFVVVQMIRRHLF